MAPSTMHDGPKLDQRQTRNDEIMMMMMWCVAELPAGKQKQTHYGSLSNVGDAGRVVWGWAHTFCCRVVLLCLQLLNKGEQGDKHYSSVVPWMESLLFQPPTNRQMKRDHEVRLDVSLIFPAVLSLSCCSVVLCCRFHRGWCRCCYCHHSRCTSRD